MKRRRPPPLESSTRTSAAPGASVVCLVAPPVAHSKAAPHIDTVIDTAVARLNPSVSSAPVVRMVCGDIPCVPISAPAAPKPAPLPIVSLVSVRCALARWYPHHRCYTLQPHVPWGDLSNKQIRAVGNCRFCTWHCVCKSGAAEADTDAETEVHAAGSYSNSSTTSASCLREDSVADESWIPGCS